MRFSDGFLDDLRERVPISDVIGKRVTWDRRKTQAGRGDWWACCPFHGEKTPSFHCEDRKGRYHCFGCGASGDHFRFLRELDGKSFHEAVADIADMAGVPLPAPDPHAQEREKERASLHDVMELAARFFQDQLQDGSGARARSYLRDRGLSGRTIEAFRLGFAPENRNALKEYLAARNVTADQMIACGLLVSGDDIPVSYDRFRNRVMFPILDTRERVIAFGGRALNADAMAKYLNSNETELFHKGRVLYNAARARRALSGLRASGSAEPQGQEEAASVIAVEGYMDVIALYQAGFDHVVAPLGTALTEDQLELLWRMSATPTLCFDGDKAGLRAAYRAVDLALARLRPGRTVRFALLPAGKDPDDLVREEGSAAFQTVLAQARPLSDMLWQREAGSGVLETPEQRASLEARLRQATAAIGDENVRRHYGDVMRERLKAFFNASSVSSAARGPGNYGRQGAGATRRDGGGFAGASARGPGARGLQGARASARLAVSERLSKSPMVSGTADIPVLRESVLVLTIINHPFLISAEFDAVTTLEFDHRGLTALLREVVLRLGSQASHDAVRLREAIESDGHGELLGKIEQQIRFARIWTAGRDAAPADAREGFAQALALHKRTRALRVQRRDLERDIAEAVDNEDGEAASQLMRTMDAVILEMARLENQDAIIDGFGVQSGRMQQT